MIMDEKLLSENSILLGAAFSNKVEAIRACGELLVAAGYAQRPYIDAMVARDEMSTIYIGNGVALPHGTEASRCYINRTGLAIVQVPDGVDFGKGNIARLLVGVAALGEEHIDLLTEIAQICVDDEQLNRLIHARTARELLAAIAPARG